MVHMLMAQAKVAMCIRMQHANTMHAVECACADSDHSPMQRHFLMLSVNNSRTQKLTFLTTRSASGRGYRRVQQKGCRLHLRWRHQRSARAQRRRRCSQHRAAARVLAESMFVALALADSPVRATMSPQQPLTPRRAAVTLIRVGSSCVMPHASNSVLKSTQQPAPLPLQHNLIQAR